MTTLTSRRCFRRPSKIYASALMLSSALMATGCASTATGVKQSSMVGYSTPQTLKTNVPAGGVLAVIRYPAVVETAAKDAYYKAFKTSVIGGKTKILTGDTELENVADSVIVKSNYFALSLYKEMAARLPDHGVLLSPHAVKLDSEGNLTSEPITQAESLPAVVSVDFATYSFPDAGKMMGNEPLTFGDLVTPLVTVRTDHLASASTQGVLFASAPLIPYAAGAGQAQAQDAMAVIQRGQFSTQAAPLDFISYLSKDTQINVSTQSLKDGAQPNSVTVYPIEKIKLDAAALSKLRRANDASIDPLEPVFSEAMAGNIVKMINRSDPDKAIMAKKAAAIAQYDPSLAALTFAGSNDVDYNVRLRYAERLLEAERKYLSVQSLRIFDGIHNGEMGTQMRNMILAEYKVLEDRRELARKQNQATAFAVLGAVAAGAVIASGAGSSNCGNAETQVEYDNCVRSQRSADTGRRILTQLAIRGAVFAGTEAVSLKNRSKALGHNYLSSIVPALEQQTTITVDLLDSSETITAIRYEDLKEKLQDMYTSRQRALDTVATRCAFEGYDGASGSWMGVCNDGKGNGSGVGVLRNTQGYSIEYYGNAINGRANGAGLMILHNPISSYTLEGTFSGGLAHGSMRVSKPGQADTMRIYRAGKDVGASNGIPASIFKTAAVQ